MEQRKLNFLLNEVKLFLNFNASDLRRLKEVYPLIKPAIPKIVNSVLKRIGGNPKLISVIENHPLPIETARTVFENWLNSLFVTNYDIAFAQRVYSIAVSHEKSGINPKYVSMAMSIFLLVTDYAVNKLDARKEVLYGLSLSIKKAMLLSLILMTESYEEVKHSKILEALEHV